MELSDAAPALEAQGVKVVGITYDSLETNRKFVAKFDISYLMLSDPDSGTFRQLGILNDEMPEGTKYFGVPYPGIYLLNADNVVIAKFAEENYRDRPLLKDVISASNALISSKLSAKKMGSSSP